MLKLLADAKITTQALSGSNPCYSLVLYGFTNGRHCDYDVLHRMIEDAEEKGLISPGMTTLVEPTSGNMGIGLAYIALTRGYRFVAVMPAEYSLDKQILLRYLGADLVLTGKDCSYGVHIVSS
jgi:hypothetical protein